MPRVTCHMLSEKYDQGLPMKMWFARFVIWFAAHNNVPHVRMRWLKPVIKYAKIDLWNPDDDYGSAATYGRVLAHCNVKAPRPQRVMEREDEDESKAAKNDHYANTWTRFFHGPRPLV